MGFAVRVEVHTGRIGRAAGVEEPAGEEGADILIWATVTTANS